jgi:UDP-N-acetyl-D-glucosamine dehydrogenase
MTDQNAGFEALSTSITNRTATIDVVGLGYVGWPLARALADAGYCVRGIDMSRNRLKDLCEAADILGIELAHAHAPIAADVVIICVPTPLTNGRPDHSLVTDACAAAGVFHNEDSKATRLLVIESTISPTFTMDVFVNCETGKWLIAHSPERIDPGNDSSYHARCTKLVGGITNTAAELTCALYASICANVHRCKDAAHAAAAKLWENSFRMVNIAAVNEFATACAAQGLDVHSVLDAAQTKHFGFMRFNPGPGAGGHCIPVDPAFLCESSVASGQLMPLLSESLNANDCRALKLAGLAYSRLQNHLPDLSPRRASVLIVGEAYKPNVDDMRNAPSLAVVSALREKVARICVVDTMTGRRDKGWDEEHDLAIIMVRHDNHPTIRAKVIVDAMAETY